MTVVTGSWLTAARVARLPFVLHAIRSHRPPGVPAQRAERVVWRSCGGPLDEVPRLIAVLAQAKLVSSGSTLRLTKEGRLVATQDHQHGGTMLARALIRASLFADQARRLAELSQADEESGGISCRRRTATENAPQLVGLLRRFDGVIWEAKLCIPASLKGEITEIWALLPARPMTKFGRRKAVGDRGESYTYHLERSRTADASSIRWVAQDDDGLGYDIEDSSTNPHRRIEVKTSGSAEPRFFLSANEWDVAQRHGSSYEVHFWGTVDLEQDPAQEYSRLRAAGYPTIYRDIVQQLADGVLTACPTQYLIEPAPQ